MSEHKWEGSWCAKCEETQRAFAAYRVDVEPVLRAAKAYWNTYHTIEDLTGIEASIITAVANCRACKG